MEKNLTTEITTEITQNLEFKDCKLLRDVAVHFVNGYFQWLSFRMGGTSDLYEFRNCYDGIKELHDVLGYIIQIVDKNKEEVKLKIPNGITRFLIGVLWR